MKHAAMIALAAVAFLFPPQPSSADLRQSANYFISSDVLSAGGAVISSDSYVAGHSLGQSSPISTLNSADFRLQEGFWTPFIPKSYAVGGDLDKADGISLVDSILALKVISRIPHQPIDPYADVNGDERIAVAEVIYILQKIAGLRD